MGELTSIANNKMGSNMPFAFIVGCGICSIINMWSESVVFKTRKWPLILLVRNPLPCSKSFINQLQDDSIFSVGSNFWPLRTIQIGHNSVGLGKLATC